MTSNSTSRASTTWPTTASARAITPVAGATSASRAVMLPPTLLLALRQTVGLGARRLDLLARHRSFERFQTLHALVGEQPLRA